MLPYTPLHHLLMAELGFAIVATSGNLANEPICIDEREAIKRLDGIASITNLCQIASFEGQAAMQLEFILDRFSTEESYPLIFQNSEIDGRSMLINILDDVINKVPVKIISAKFHNSLIDAIVKIAQQMKVEKIVLTGGCFQNKYLIEKAIEKLRQAGFNPYWHHRIPTNDGGIALGQAIAAILVETRDRSRLYVYDLFNRIRYYVFGSSRQNSKIELIDRAIVLANLPNTIFCSFGDLLRVPGMNRDLPETARRLTLYLYDCQC